MGEKMKKLAEKYGTVCRATDHDEFLVCIDNAHPQDVSRIGAIFLSGNKILVAHARQGECEKTVVPCVTKKGNGSNASVFSDRYPNINIKINENVGFVIVNTFGRATTWFVQTVEEPHDVPPLEGVDSRFEWMCKSSVLDAIFKGLIDGDANPRSNEFKQSLKLKQSEDFAAQIKVPDHDSSFAATTIKVLSKLYAFGAL